jgi:hypothetical protein
VIAKAVSKLEDHERSPAQIAKQRWGKTNPTLCKVIEAGIVTKTAVQGGSADTSVSPDPWGAELVSADSRFTGDFIEFLHDKTVFDQLPLREVPANVTIKGQDGAATGYWVGESKGVPVSAQSFSTVNLTYLKVGALAVVSNELLKHSSPAAEMFVRDALVAASAERIDTSFLGGGAGTAGVEPAGILQGVSTLGSNGYDAAAVRDDIRELYAPFLTAKHASGLILVMTPARAKAVSLMVNTLGQTEFPGLNAGGGTLLGDTVVTGDNVGATTVILLDPREIWKIGDSGVEVSLSRDATIEMDTAPTVNSQEPDSADGEFVSMYQTESTAFKIVRPMNFQKRRTTAAAFISDVGWGDSSTTTA